MVYPGAGVPQSTGSAWGTSITLGTGVATALAAAVSGTGDICLASGSACAGGGGNTTSTSLTTGYLPKASGANAIINSAADDGITTANTFTYSGSGGINASGGPIAAGGSTSGLSLSCTTPATPASGFLGITVASTCTNYGFYNFQALPASAGILHAAAISSHVSAVTVGPIVGADMTNATVTATQLAAQYSEGQCTEVWGGSGTSFALTSGDDAISNNSCYNDSGVTRTITALKCRSDNGSNTTTVNPTFGSAGTGTTILSGALTCGNSYAYSSSGTISNASWTTGSGITPAMAGTLTGTSIAMIVEYTF
jgi:hypothetical protein